MIDASSSKPSSLTKRKIPMQYIVAGAVLVLLLVGGGVGLYLSQRSAETRQQASGGGQCVGSPNNNAACINQAGGKINACAGRGQANCSALGACGCSWQSDGGGTVNPPPAQGGTGGGGTSGGGSTAGTCMQGSEASFCSGIGFGKPLNYSGPYQCVCKPRSGTTNNCWCDPNDSSLAIVGSGCPTGDICITPGTVNPPGTIPDNISCKLSGVAGSCYKFASGGTGGGGTGTTGGGTTGGAPANNCTIAGGTCQTGSCSNTDQTPVQASCGGDASNPGYCCKPKSSTSGGTGSSTTCPSGTTGTPSSGVPVACICNNNPAKSIILGSSDASGCIVVGTGGSSSCPTGTINAPSSGQPITCICQNDQTKTIPVGSPDASKCTTTVASGTTGTTGSSSCPAGTVGTPSSGQPIACICQNDPRVSIKVGSSDTSGCNSLQQKSCVQLINNGGGSYFGNLLSCDTKPNHLWDDVRCSCVSCPVGTSTFSVGGKVSCSCNNAPSVAIAGGSADSSLCANGGIPDPCTPDRLAQLAGRCPSGQTAQCAPGEYPKCAAPTAGGTSGGNTSPTGCPTGTTGTPSSGQPIACICQNNPTVSIGLGSPDASGCSVSVSNGSSCPTGTTGTPSSGAPVACICNNNQAKSIALGSSDASACSKCTSNSQCSSGKVCNIAGNCVIPSGSGSGSGTNGSCSTAGQSCDSKLCCGGSNLACQGVTGSMICQQMASSNAAQCPGGSCTGYYGFTCSAGQFNSRGECLSNGKPFLDAGSASAYAGGCGQVDQVCVNGSNAGQLCGDFSIRNSSCGGGGGTPPSTPPASNPPAPMCLSIAMNGTPAVNQAVTFTCGQVAGANHYEFRVKQPDGTFAALSPSSASSNVSASYTITQSGAFSAQCRICTGADASTCQAYDSL